MVKRGEYIMIPLHFSTHDLSVIVWEVDCNEGAVGNSGVGSMSTVEATRER